MKHSSRVRVVILQALAWAARKVVWGHSPVPRPYRVSGGRQVGVAVGVALVELQHIFGQGVGGPEDLGITLLADPVRHLQALQQVDEAAEVNRQRQAHHFDNVH